MITKFSNVVKYDLDKINSMTLRSPGDGTFYELKDEGKIQYLEKILDKVYLLKIPFNLAASTGTYNYKFYDSDENLIFSVGFISDKFIEINDKYYFVISKISNGEFNLETYNLEKPN